MLGISGRYYRVFEIHGEPFQRIVFSIDHFKIYLFDREITVRSDHRPLQWSKNMDNPSKRLARWLIIVRQFDFKIEFIDGHMNAAADALSRFVIFDEEETNEESEPGIILNHIRIPRLLNEKQSNDDDIRQLCEWIIAGKRPEKINDGSLSDLMNFYKHFPKFRLIEGNVYREFGTRYGQTYFEYVVPKEERPMVFELLHDSSLSGHLARDKTLEIVQQRFYWPRSYSETVRSCSVVRIMPKIKVAFKQFTIVKIDKSEPFELVTMDIIGPIMPESTNGNKYICYGRPLYKSN